MTDSKLIGVMTQKEKLNGTLSNKSEINVTVTSIGSSVRPYVHPETHPASMIVETSDRMFMTQDDKIDIQTALRTYVHEQIVSNNIWNIYHGLEKYPSITVVDSAGSVVSGDIQYTNENEVILRFNSEFSGYAYMN